MDVSTIFAAKYFSAEMFLTKADLKIREYHKSTIGTKPPSAWVFVRASGKVVEN